MLVARHAYAESALHQVISPPLTSAKRASARLLLEDTGAVSFCPLLTEPGSARKSPGDRVERVTKRTPAACLFVEASKETGSSRILFCIEPLTGRFVNASLGKGTASARRNRPVYNWMLTFPGARSLPSIVIGLGVGGPA